MKDITEVQPHMILMDHWIPEIGGVQAIRLIKKTTAISPIPVMLFTVNDPIAELSKEAGADGYLSKPFEVAENRNFTDRGFENT